MPDIELRFHKDMLVLSAPIDTVLARQGVNVERDREFLSLIEPESVRDALRMESLAGAQCLVTNTQGVTAARLAHVNMEDRAVELTRAALRVTNSLTPQHVFAEIGPTGLPLDGSSALSLKQNRDQYAQAARDFGTECFDAFFLNGQTSITDMQCALMGVRLVCDKPLLASVAVDAAGTLMGRTQVSDSEGNLLGHTQTIEEAVAVMIEHGADAVGFATSAPLKDACALVKRVQAVTAAPLLVQLEVIAHNPKQGQATDANPYFCADVMVEAATLLRGAGVQFLRACGNATPAYTGALAAASAGFDVMRKSVVGG